MINDQLTLAHLLSRSRRHIFPLVRLKQLTDEVQTIGYPVTVRILYFTTYQWMEDGGVKESL